MRFITIFLLFASCSSGWKANWQLRRAENLIKKAELNGGKFSTDTIMVKDTVFIASVKYDTVSILLPGDSIIIDRERLKVIVKRIKGDTVKVLAECKPDTIIRNIPVQVNNEIKAEKSVIPWWGWAIIIFLCLIVVRLLFK